MISEKYDSVIIMNILVEKFGERYSIAAGADTVPIQWVEGLKNKVDTIYLLGGLNLHTDDKPWDWAGYTLDKFTGSGIEENTYWNVEDIWDVIKKEDIDVIHAHTRGRELNHINSKLKKEKGVPIIYTVHGMDSLTNPLDEEMFKIADVITVPSPYVKNIMESRGYGDKVIWIPNSTDFHKYKNDPYVISKAMEIRANYCDSDGEKLILITGRLQEDKGIYELAEAVCELLKEEYKLKMIHCGIIFSEEEKKKLENIFKKHGFEDKLVLLGKIPEDKEKDLAAVYKAADLFILPSDGTYETFGMSTLEALSLGTPSIVSMVGGPKSVYVDYGLAIGVKPRDKDAIRDAIKYYLMNEEQEIERAKVASRVIEMFYSTDFVTELLLKLYERVTHRP